MGFRLSLRELVGATLPGGFGFVAFLGVAPGGGECHLLCPVAVELALPGCSGAPLAAPPGARPGWHYHLVPTYSPPAGSGCATPSPERVRAAREARARASAQQLMAWASRRGWWAELTE